MLRVPVFLDVDPGCFTLGNKAIEQIEKYKIKTVALVQLFGEMANPNFINYCRSNSIKIVEDATHVLGGASSLMDDYVGGKVGDVSCFSFQSTKTVSAGQGGALVTDDEEIYRRASIFSKHGIDKASTGKYYWAAELGYNFSISDFQAALIFSQLSQVRNLFEFRSNLLSMFKEAFNKYKPQEFNIAPNFEDKLNIPYLL